MAVRDSFVAIVAEVLAAIQAGRFEVEILRLVDRIEGAVESAIDDEPDMVRSLISLMNLLRELRSGSLECAMAEPFLSALAKSVHATPANCLQGDDARPEEDPEIRLGSTMIKWRDFLKFFARKYGLSETSVADQQRAKERVRSGNAKILSEHLDLTSRSGVVWITDHVALQKRCPSGAPTEIDGTVAYDTLGLDWLGAFTYEGAVATAEAVVVSAPMSVRRNGRHGVRVPNALDAWGGFGFSPSERLAARSWPSAAGQTVDPVTGTTGLPEAVHGTLTLAAGTECPVMPCSLVRKADPDRVSECGRQVCWRLLAALRSQ